MPIEPEPFHPLVAYVSGHVATITIALPDWAVNDEAAHRAALDVVEAQAELLRSALEDEVLSLPGAGEKDAILVDVYDDEHPLEDEDEDESGWRDGVCPYPGCLGPADGSECRHPRD